MINLNRQKIGNMVEKQCSESEFPQFYPKNKISVSVYHTLLKGTEST